MYNLTEVVLSHENIPRYFIHHVVKSQSFIYKDPETSRKVSSALPLSAVHNKK